VNQKVGEKKGIMNMSNYSVSLSGIDEERFGIRTAKAILKEPEELMDVFSFCLENKVNLLIARCLTSCLGLAQDMESLGFSLMDTLIYYSCNLIKNPPSPPEHFSEITIRPFKKGEENIVKAISAKAFEGYLGHYQADRRLDRQKSNEVYIDWAYQSCLSKNLADIVFVADYNGTIAGFATMRINSPIEIEGVLFGVDPSFQGKGVYQNLIINGMKWGIEEGHEKMNYSTQINNVAVQRVLSRFGFEPIYSYYTFHKWFDDASKALGNIRQRVHKLMCELRKRKRKSGLNFLPYKESL
jgi:GNAT superfamily N-acetyltransferase